MSSVSIVAAVSLTVVLVAVLVVPVRLSLIEDYGRSSDYGIPLTFS